MGQWDNLVSKMSSHLKSHDKYIRYGTAGFRYKAELLDHVIYR